jgi:hypothetical protein
VAFANYAITPANTAPLLLQVVARLAMIQRRKLQEYAAALQALISTLLIMYAPLATLPVSVVQEKTLINA